ncbi:MAG: hypothetical protein V1861_06325 [Candidatus Micrarchaeota archaeon]
MHRNLLVPLLLFTLIQTAAAQEVNITRYLYVNASASCPGNMLLMNATASDGLPAPDVELRLVLYLPYQGLRALQHTDKDGLASVELTKNGSYRIYMNTDAYEHEKFVEFEYPRMCPPPPPQPMNISIEPDCENLRLSITTKANETGAPLEGVFLLAGNWSSFSGKSGSVSVPFEKGYVFIRVERANYTGQEFYFDASCLPPSECLADGDCSELEFCSGGNCTNVTGACGYPENHSWVAYGCCADADCGNESMFCGNNTCMIKPLPPDIPLSNATNISNMINESNATGNETGATEESVPSGACTAVFILLIALACRTRAHGH